MSYHTGSGSSSTGTTSSSSTAKTSFVVTVATYNGANVFYIDGVAKPVLELERGQTHTFVQSDSTNVGHQIAFKQGGVAYTTNVTNTGTLGQAGAQTTIEIPASSSIPGSFSYYCAAHGDGMGNSIRVTKPIRTYANATKQEDVGKTSESSDTNPHIRDKYSPLGTLSMQALRRFGDYAPGTVDGDVMLMFIEFANMVIDDIRMHPYRDLTVEIDYYDSQNDSRAIEDIIIVNGLLYHYSMQQMSEKAQFYQANYFRTLNSKLWESLNGNTNIKMRIVDDGTNPRNFIGSKTSNYNGLVTDAK
tara:strand:+ start:332 stop:1240 length:909 start_codon:yes stop_codon:yes gene_type:complete